MIALDSAAGFATALRHAHKVTLDAYLLPPGAVRCALAAAARRGAAVRVRLERRPLEAGRRVLAAANRTAVAELRRAGVDAALTAAGEPALHLKAAVIDGVAWLADRNWTGVESVVRDDDPADVAAIRAALAGQAAGSAALATTKCAAEALECELIRTAGTAPLGVESESFGDGPVARELLRRARAGRPTRLLVAGREAGARGPAGARERRLLARLAAGGVDVRLGVAAGAEKLAVAGGRGWVGSANATWAGGRYGEQRDWGLAVRDPALAAGLRGAFERDWAAARPLSPG